MPTAGAGDDRDRRERLRVREAERRVRGRAVRGAGHLGLAVRRDRRTARTDGRSRPRRARPRDTRRGSTAVAPCATTYRLRTVSSRRAAAARHLGVVEEAAQRVDDRERLVEIDGPDADGQRRHGAEGTGRVGRSRSSARRATATRMLTFASDAHRQHHPRQPFHDQGHMIDPPEVPERAERIRAAIATAGIGPILAPDRARPRTDPARAHRRLRRVPRARARPLARARPNAAEHAEAVPYARPIRGQPLDRPAHPIAALGWYSHDNDAILAGTWAAAVGAVDVTMSALARRGRRRRAAPRTRSRGRPAITRRPTRTPATASSTTRPSPPPRGPSAAPGSAILDVDYHHGNGTQQIFYDRGDVCFVSLHADPAYEYPFFSGFSSRARRRPRRRHHAQLPAPARHRVGHVRARARDAARRRSRGSAPTRWSCRSASTPPPRTTTRSNSSPTTSPASARRSATLGLPTVLVQEGGYDLDVIGRNVVNVLRG